MDFNEYYCPVCKVRFKDGDDIVVCPECGAPHHRECYEKENRCAFYDRHGEGFSFENNEEAQQTTESENPDTVICPRCGSSNQKGMFYCGKCGFPLGAQQTQQQAQNRQTQSQQSSPFSGFGVPFGEAFDPMAGVNPNEDMGGVTAGEMSKYVQKNTPYFIKVFNSIRLFNNSRFNFCAFLFGGAYLLYRKMYKLGGVFAALMILLTGAELYFSISVANILSNGSFTTYADIFKLLSSLSIEQQMMFMLMSLCSVLNFIPRILSGAFANRWYFSHCKSEIIKIKKDSANPQQEFETKGGVNMAIAVSVMAIILVLNELPAILSMLQ
ncbi:MAG: DUF2628 domain-containing protein [Ruminococcus sp.]|nr:DUF2628 domain-containing protein [Ruminococcus sp.]